VGESMSETQGGRANWIPRAILLVQCAVILGQQWTIFEYKQTVAIWKTSANEAWSAISGADRQIEADKTQLAENSRHMVHCNDVRVGDEAAMSRKNKEITLLRTLVELYERYVRTSVTGSGGVTLGAPGMYQLEDLHEAPGTLHRVFPGKLLQNFREGSAPALPPGEEWE
jgi:hypothetical protein